MTGIPFVLDRGPERAEAGLIEVAPIDGAPDLKALEPEFVHRPVHLGDGEIDVLEGHRGSQRHETVRVGGHDRRQIVVLNAGRLRGEIGRRPVVVLGDKSGQALDIDPHPVHVLDPGIGVGELVDDRRVHDLVLVLGVLTHEEVVWLVFGTAVLVDRASAGRGGQMAVDVDRGHVGSGTITGKERGVA